MITRKILSKPVGRILAIVLVLVCCWYIIIDAKAAVTIGRGYVEVNIVGGEAREPDSSERRNPAKRPDIITL